MKRAFRIISLVLGVAVGAVAGVAAASSLAGSAPEESFPTHAVVAGSESVEGKAAAPRGGNPWAVAMYESDSGETCAALGELENGRVGYRSAGGHGFVPFTLSEDASCGPDRLLSRAAPLHRHLSARLTPDGPVVSIWGVARSDVASVRVESPLGTDEVPVSRRGAFLVNYATDKMYPLPAGSRVTLVSTFRDGGTARQYIDAPVTPPDEPSPESGHDDGP